MKHPTEDCFVTDKVDFKGKSIHFRRFQSGQRCGLVYYFHFDPTAENGRPGGLSLFEDGG